MESSRRVLHVATIDLSLNLLLLSQLKAIGHAGFEVHTSSAPGPDVATLRAAGIPHWSVNFTRRMTPARDAKALAQLVGVMRKIRPLIVHTHNPKPGLLGQLAARIAGVPIVVNTLHGFYFDENTAPSRRRFYAAMERVAARCSDLILSQNPEDIETAVREGIAPRHKLRHLGNGIDIERFDASRFPMDQRGDVRGKLGIPEGHLVVTFVGRLVREKGLAELMTALAAIRGRVPPFTCLIIGPSEEEKADAIETSLADELGVGDLCRFLGRRSDIPELLAISDVFALPSYREGFPRSPMEAAAMSVPVVVTRIRGCVETVVDGQTGILVERGDVASLSDALAVLLTDRGRRERMGKAGRALAIQKFDERNVFTTVLEAYDELLTLRLPDITR